MQGLSGPGGISTTDWKDWKLCYGPSSRDLWKDIYTFLVLACKHLPNMVNIAGHFSGIFIGMDKLPGVCLVRIIDNLKNMLGKYILHACRMDHM